MADIVRKTYYLDFTTASSYDDGGEDRIEVEADDPRANLYSSEIAGCWPPLHAPVIDFDVPVRLVPSSTPGHSHLYVDVPMSWGDYAKLLGVLVDVGVVEPGYLGATLERGAGFVRMPGVTK